eukprot:10918948-Alexandrium_andersonii.AAC.1
MTVPLLLFPRMPPLAPRTQPPFPPWAFQIGGVVVYDDCVSARCCERRNRRLGALAPRCPNCWLGS